MESQPQNPELRINPENCHPWEGWVRVNGVQMLHVANVKAFCMDTKNNMVKFW